VTRIALALIVGLAIFQVTREIGRMGAPAPSQSPPAAAGMDIGLGRE